MASQGLASRPLPGGCCARRADGGGTPSRRARHARDLVERPDWRHVSWAVGTSRAARRSPTSDTPTPPRVVSSGRRWPRALAPSTSRPPQLPATQRRPSSVARLRLWPWRSGVRVPRSPPRSPSFGRA